MQLRPVAAAAILSALAWPLSAAADGEVAVRGAYYKEKATRVQQPMVDARFGVGEQGELSSHFLVDVITSASVAAGRDGEEFQEVRYEHGASYARALARIFQVGGGYRVSTEPDYDSVFLSARGQAELAQRNTTLALALAQGFDTLSNGNSGAGPGAAVEGELKTSLASLSVSQVLSPVAVAGLTYDVSYLRGFLENPYRLVPVAMEDGEAVQIPERVPDDRLRHAVFGSLRAFVPPTTTTIIAGYRYYLDDWGVRAHTPELRVVQSLRDDDTAWARLRYRYYRQTAADFYRDTYDGPQEFMTDDPKLDAFTTHTIGLQLATELQHLGFSGNLADARLELLVEYLQQNNRFGDAFIGQLALTMPLRY